MLLVEKYGGSSVSTISKIKRIANHLKKSVLSGNKIVVVLSAMGKTTNKLVSLSKKVCKNPNKREQDVLLCTGEMISVSLLTMALDDIGTKAISLCGFQAGIKTTSDFSKALIKSINSYKLKSFLKTYDVVVVAGFQGIDERQNLTTLGRGGSDTTATSLAASLNCPCNIFTDVECVFSANPIEIKRAKKHHKLFVDTMLEMASCGAKVLDTRCLEIAKKFNVPLFLGKSLENDKTKGTKIFMNNDFEQPKVVSICGLDELCVFEVSRAKINHEQILKVLKDKKQNLYMQGFGNQICFVVQKNEAKNIENFLKNHLKLAKVKVFEDFCQISLVGFGFCSHPKFFEDALKLLSEKNIFPKQFAVTETRISLVLKQQQKKKAQKILTEHFEVLE